MQKYVATKGAEVIGIAMHNFFVSLNQDEFQTVVKEVFKQYSVSRIDNDKWYPHQLSLDVFRLINEGSYDAATHLTALGVAYVETAVFPPEINTIQSALIALATTYHLNIRNVPAQEGYAVEQPAANHIRIKDFNPFPHETVYGFIWGIAKRFRKAEQHFVVKQTYLNPTHPDMDGAVYDVTITG